MIQTDTGNKTTLRNYEIALIQMDTQNDKGENMKKACRFIDEAAGHGAKLICFPEVMNLIGRNTGEGGGKEEIPGYTSDILCRKAREHKVWIHGGSITEQVPGQKKSRNLSLLINPDGEIAAHIAHLTLGQFHQLRIAGAGTVNELHTGQIFRAAGIRGAAAKQQRLIAHGLPVDLIHFHLLRGQKFRHHSGNGLAGEFHIQNVILIGDFF